jgi:son of sevenless-like protein
VCVCVCVCFFFKPLPIGVLGVYQTDLMFIEQGNNDLLANGLINFQKCRQAADVIREIMLYQQPYNLVTVASIQNYLHSSEFVREYSDEELFEASLRCEPREAST